MFNDYEIIVICETFLKEHDNFQLKGYNIIRFDRDTNERGGIAILLKNHIRFDTLVIDLKFDQIEVGAVNIETTLGQISLIAYYRSPTHLVGNSIADWKKEWAHLTDFIKKLDKFIFVGDFNAHHPWWGSTHSCSYGNAIFDSIDLEYFALLNDGSPTHFSVSNNFYSTSNIDLTFVSSNLLLRFPEWHVLSDSWGSDHFPIVISGLIDFHQNPKVDYRYNLKKLNWETFLEELEVNKGIFSSLKYLNSTVITKYELFISTIDKCIMKSMPLTSQRLANKCIDNICNTKNNVKPRCIWWSEECDRVIRLRKAKLASLKYKCDLQKYIDYKKICAITRRTLKAEKKNSFIKFCSSINRNTNISSVWSKIKMFKNGCNRPQSTDGNTKLHDKAKETLDDLCTPKNATLCSPINIDTDSNQSALTKDHFLAELFSYEEITLAINSSNLKSSPGVDKISYEILSSLPEFYIRVLLDILNDIYQTGIFPETWHTYLITFIPKNNGQKVRPISMASCLLKTLERMINTRLNYWVEKNDILSGTQFGFRKGKSCADNVSILTNDIHQAFYKKESLTALFLDVKGAFDNIIPDILIQDLQTLGLPKVFVKFIYNLIYSRSLLPVDTSLGAARTVNKGLPQGSVLSPILYSLYTHSNDKFINKSVKILQFADDIVIYSTHKNTNSALVQLEYSANNLSNHLKSRGLEIAPEKSQLVIFNKHNSRIEYHTLDLNDCTLLPSNTAKFLGMTLDKKLNWKAHIDQTVMKCYKAINILSCLRGTWWGGDPLTLLMLYKSLIRSKLEYCGFLIHPCAKSNLDKLDKIQNICLRIAMGYRNSTPLNVIAAETNVPSLNGRFKILGYKYLLKHLSYYNSILLDQLETLKELNDYFVYAHNHSKSLLTECFENIWFYNLSIIRHSLFYKYNYSYHSSLFVPSVDLRSNKILKDSEDPLCAFCNKFLDSEHTHIFTDGSKISLTRENERDSASSVGFASWSEDDDFKISYKIHDSASIFTAESLAIHAVVDTILTSTKEKFKIYTDSESVLKSLQNLNSNKTESVLIIMLRPL
uniref:Reverse transcriptase domain-containing protein n=1 Tax=Trichogramma kaykai TaxID=54128 RepID=A0ABD2XMY4_9HYME